MASMTGCTAVTDGITGNSSSEEISVIVTPTVPSMPIAAIAIQYNPNWSPPNSLAPRIPREMRTTGTNVDIIPTDSPAIAFVAGRL